MDCSQREQGTLCGGSWGASFLLGAIVGIAVGMLYAPRPGVETRAILVDKTNKVYEKVSEVLDGLKQNADSLRDRVTGRL